MADGGNVELVASRRRYSQGEIAGSMWNMPQCPYDTQTGNRSKG